MRLTERAPAKLNLCLYLGAMRADGLHELVSVFEPIDLYDTLTIAEGGGQPGGGGAIDTVVCPGVDGENLVGRALAACRREGLLDGPPLTVTIEKRIPVAAGLGGGSADAAAVLRALARDGRLMGGAAAQRAPSGRDRLAEGPLGELAFTLGADVPSQLDPAPMLVEGAGERLTPIAPEALGALGAADRAYLIVPQSAGLATATVYARADTLGTWSRSLPEDRVRLSAALAAGSFDALVETLRNDLQPAIVDLRPELAGIPARLRETGALYAAFTGSGPTCFGIYDGAATARAARAALDPAIAAGALVARPIARAPRRPAE